MDRKKGQIYQKEYEEDFYFITSSGRSEQHAFCTLCRLDILVSRCGRNDIVLHSQSKLHISNFDSDDLTRHVTSFMSTPQDLDGARAECLFASLILEQNISPCATHNVGPLLRNALPNSDEVIRNFQYLYLLIQN